MSPDKSHVLKAGWPQLSEGCQQLCASPSPRRSPTPSLDSSCPWRALPASSLHPGSLPRPAAQSLGSSPLLTEAASPASQLASQPEPPTNHANEGQQLGTWAHPQLSLVSLAANRKTQGLQGLWEEAARSQPRLPDDASLSTRQKNTPWLPAPGCFQKRNLI